MHCTCPLLGVKRTCRFAPHVCLAPKVETDNGKQAGATRFTIVLEAEPGIDAIRNLRVALKVLKRRYGLRVVTIRET